MKSILAAVCLLAGLSSQASQIAISTSTQTFQSQNEYYRIDFGNVFVNARTTSRYTLTNTGNTPLTFKETYIYGADFDADQACRGGLLPNESCNFSISYWPKAVGVSSGSFVLGFYEDQVTFDLWGRAVKR